MATTAATAATTALNTVTTAIVSATASLSSTLSSASIPAASSPTMSISPAPNAHGVEGESMNDSTKIVGLSLAIGSGLLIGASFVFKKKGLINCTKHGMLAGEGHDYLKSVMWWTGMLMMVAGEVCNFVAYAFVQPILVTPLGALSVVICAILSSIFLKERLNLQGKVGCAQCIIGATIIVLHAPEQTSVKTIQEFAHFMKQPVFLVWMFIIILLSLWLIIKAGPRWGKDHMMVYIGVCSLIGSLSVVSTQALGAAIVHNISTGEPQFNTWFTYFVIVFMVITLLTEINYLNKALNLFNTAMVTPTYYVTFTSTTIITSAILYQGFHASVVAILTVCFGFLVICGGVLLLQTSKPVVPLHVPGSSSSGGTITYDDIEPNAADMRASPFSSIRRISRDLRQPSIIHGSNSVYQGSPLNPMLQRKRRASNAAQRSRPQSVLAGHGHLLAPPGGTGTAGGATAFYPSSTGAYSTMVMGPNGSQVRLQLCEIVISDEKNETQSRYQVYRPIPPLGDVGTTTGYRQQQQQTLQSRTGVPSDSRSSSVRFGDNVARPSQEENEKEEYHHHPPTTPVQKYPSPISGSLFVPPKVTTTSNSSAASPTAAAPGSPSSPTGASGPLVVGGSFYGRPRFRSPSTSTAASGDIMEINDPGHAGRTVVSIEPVQQQPLYSLYVPPPPPVGTATHQRPTSPLASAPLQPVDSTSSSSSSASSSTANNVVGGHNDLASLHEKNALGHSTTYDGQDESSDGISSPLVVAAATTTATAGTSVNTKGNKSHGIFGKLFSKGPQKKNSSKNLNPSGTSLLPLTNSLDSSDGSPPGSPLSSPSSPLPPPPQIVFNRANHPTRISEGEEEEDAEDLKQQSG